MARRLLTAVRVAAAGVTRAVRGLWPDRNPLRRGVDRAEAVIFGGLAALFLTLAPLVAVTSSHVVYNNAYRAVISEHSWHLVPAVLLSNAPTGLGAGYRASVRAYWAAPDGSRRTGSIAAPPDAKAGSTVKVWTDAAGHLTHIPLRMSQASGQAVLVAILAPAALGFALLCAGGLAHAGLGRLRRAAWDSDWQVTEPRWTHQR